MAISLTDLLIALLLLSALALWWSGQGARQLALGATRRYCDRMDVQLLDETVALRGVWLKRDDRGNVRVWRSYNFEFSSTGNERYSGRVVMLGRRIELIQLDPHRLN